MAKSCFALALSPSPAPFLPCYPCFSVPRSACWSLSRSSSAAALTNTCTPKVDAPWTAEVLPAIPTTTTAATSTATATSTLTALLTLHRSPGVAFCCSLFLVVQRPQRGSISVTLLCPSLPRPALPPHSIASTVALGTRLVVVLCFASLMSLPSILGLRRPWRPARSIIDNTITITRVTKLDSLDQQSFPSAIRSLGVK